MTRDEAMKVWLEACETSQEAWCAVGEQPNDPEGDAQGRLANEAAATVIQQAFAEREEAIRQVGVQQGLDMAAAFCDGYAGGHYMAQSCATAIRKLGGDDVPG